MALLSEAAACRGRMKEGSEAARAEALGLLAQLGQAGERAAEADEHEHARDLASKAVALLRVLAADERERFGPSLAHALTNLGASLSRLGSESAMHEPLAEAMALYRELDRVVEAVGCASELGLSLVALGRADEALAPLSQAREWIAMLDSDAAHVVSVELLDHLGLCLRALGRDAEAVECWREALDLAGQRGASASVEQLRRAATISSQLAALLERVGPAGAKVMAWRIAVERWLGLVERRAELDHDPRTKLAEALDNLGLALSDQDRGREALAVTREAVALRRDLAHEEPELHRSTFATSLTNLAIDLESNGEPEAALSARVEALEHLKVLVEAEPEDRLGSLAEALGDLSLSLVELGRVREARTEATACVEAARALVVFDPEYYGPELARALDVRASVACEARDHAAGFVDLDEALALLVDEGETELAGGPRHAELIDECLATYERLVSEGSSEVPEGLRDRVEALRSDSNA